jgi:hypothetical protein
MNGCVVRLYRYWIVSYTIVLLGNIISGMIDEWMFFYAVSILDCELHDCVVR